MKQVILARPAEFDGQNSSLTEWRHQAIRLAEAIRKEVPATARVRLFAERGDLDSATTAVIEEALGVEHESHEVLMAMTFERDGNRREAASKRLGNNWDAIVAVINHSNVRERILQVFSDKDNGGIVMDHANFPGEATVLTIEREGRAFLSSLPKRS